jgi:hypothetical protein
VKRDSKSILSVSLVIINLTSPASKALLASPYDIREDSVFISSIDVEDDAIPAVEKVPTNAFVGLKNFPRGLFFSL